MKTCDFARDIFQIGDEVGEKGRDLLAFEVSLAEHLRDALVFRFAVDLFQQRARKRRHNLPVKLFPAILPQIAYDVLKRSTPAIRAIRRHRIERVREGNYLRAQRNLLVRQSIRITTTVESLVMVLRHQRYVRVRMVDRRENLVTRRRMPVQLARILCVDVVRRVDDVAIDDQLADVVQVTGNLNSLDFFFTPTQLARDDLAVLADAFRVTLRVLVLDVDRRRERAHRVAIDRAQVFIQPAILFRALGQLFEQTMRVNADADVPHHRADRFEVVAGKIFPTRLATQQDQTGYFTAHDHRQHELDAFRRELVTVPFDEAV